MSRGGRNGSISYVILEQVRMMRKRLDTIEKFAKHLEKMRVMRGPRLTKMPASEVEIARRMYVNEKRSLGYVSNAMGYYDKTIERELQAVGVTIRRKPRKRTVPFTA